MSWNKFDSQFGHQNSGMTMLATNRTDMERLQRKVIEEETNFTVDLVLEIYCIYNVHELRTSSIEVLFDSSLTPL
jgi:hypothetical protein